MKRLGFTLIELSAAIAVLAVCALLFVQLAAITASERVRERARQTAIDQMQNIWERLETIPPETLVARFNNSDFDNSDFDNSDFDSTLFDNGAFDKRAAEALIKRSLPDGRITFATKEIDIESLKSEGIESEGDVAPRTVILTMAVSWSDGEKRPRSEAAMFRLLTLKEH